MSNKPRILIIENSIDLTGALKSITRSSFDLGGDFEFQFVIPKKSSARFWIESFGFKYIYEFQMVEISRRISSWLLYFPCLFMNAIKLSLLVRRNSISLIHVNDIYNLLPAVIRLFGNRTPYVCHIRFQPDKFPPWIFNFWFNLHLRYSHQIVTVSKSVMSKLPKHEKVILIYNELPVKELYPDLIAPKQDKPVHTFLYLSNFIQGKGHDFALKAFSKIHHMIPSWKMRFVGGVMGLKKNEVYKQGLFQKAKELEILDKIEWEGFTNGVEMEYKSSDIVLNFSESESFSMTCVEALFFGRPVIVTDCGGPAEILGDSKIGVLVPNRDTEAMANAMQFLAENNTIRTQMGELARLVVRQKFSFAETSERLKLAYSKILNE